MKLPHYAVKHPAVIGMVLCAAIVFGFVSLSGMNVAFMGELSLPSVAVITVYPGAGAEDVEREVTDVLEEDFVTLSGLKNITSSSKDSVSLITLFFQDGTDPYERLAEVRNRINKKTEDLPEGIRGIPDALVGGDEMLPVISFSVSGGRDTGQLAEYIAETLKPRLSAIAGVSQVQTVGGEKLRLNIKLRTDDANAKNIPVSRVYEAIRRSNVQLPAGKADYETRNIDLRYDGSFESIRDMENLIVGAGDNNVPIRLKDIADIFLGYPESDVKVSDGARDIIVIDVKKRSNANVMRIAKKVKQIIREAEADTGDAVGYDIISDDSRTVKASIKTVIYSGITGIVMAVVMLVLFLQDARSTLIIGLSIPLSLVMTLIGMKLAGIGINLMSLSGMVVSLGMTVDASIVMIEQIYRYYTSGYTIEDAVCKGADEVGASVFAGAATTLVVFLPIALLKGLIGMMLRDVALTLIFAISASLCTALVAVPFFMKVLLNKTAVKEKKLSRFNRTITLFERLYARALKKALNKSRLVVSAAALILVLTFFLIKLLGITFIPVTDNSDYYASFTFPAGQNLETTRKELEKAQRIIAENIPHVEKVVLYAGQTDNFISASAAENEGYARIILKPASKRKEKIPSLILKTQHLLSSLIPDAQIRVTNGGFDRLLGFVAGGGGFGISLQGSNTNELYAEALRLRNFLEKDPETLSVSIDMNFDAATLVLDMNRDYLNALGVSSYEAGLTAAILFRGTDAGQFRDRTSGKTYDIRLFSDIKDNPLDEKTLSNVRVQSRNGGLVSFAALADKRIEQNISSVNRKNRIKTVTVSAVLVNEDTSGVNKRLRAYLNKNPLKKGIRADSSGIMELLEDSIPRMIKALLIACFAVYAVMVIQFERFRQPLLVMVSIPFSLIGVTFGLLSFGSSISLMALMGIVSLSGIVVNNGIILIDYINLLRKTDNTAAAKVQGTKKDALLHENALQLKEIIIRASSSRLRPILMTTLTTVFGVIPMAFSRGEGSEVYASLAQAIAGGLCASTLITLFIIPVLYYMTEKNAANPN
ncbi:efflux RND transporter permease subunit [Treponema sp. HNW]|uniref:efflux RND transporter permease subunit n=1 Tax=Treponema sp. HNW TaxID=3116654 RepID=UPI003D14266E